MWQPSLLDAGEPRVDVSFAALRRLHLDDESWIDYCPGWLSGSDAVFAELLQAGAWRQRELWMYDRVVAEPRLTAGWSIGDAAGQPVRAWTREVPGDQAEGAASLGDAHTPAVLRQIAGPLNERYGVEFDSVWVNLYRDGSDSVAWHGDRNAKVLTNPLVVTVSLGCRRGFVLRRRGTTRIAHRLAPGHGDLVVMGGACQHSWEHSVPKTRRPVGPRMSVTMRHSR